MRAVVGEAAWRREVEKVENIEDRLTTAQTEAFTMLQLENNYYAWLCEAKLAVGGERLVTDYDIESKRSGKKLISHYVQGYQIDLDLKIEDAQSLEEPEDEETELDNGGTMINTQPPAQDQETKKVVLTKEEDPERFEVLKKKTESALKALCASLKNNSDYKSIKDCGKGIAAATPENKGNKRRKVLKNLRLYTTPQKNEPKFRGWSPRAEWVMVKTVQKIQEETEKYKAFSRAYREIYKATASKAKGHKQENKRHDANYEVAWGIKKSDIIGIPI